MLQVPNNKLIVKVKSKYSEYISRISRLSSQQHDASIDIADYVEIRGVVVSLPKSITTNRLGYEGFSTQHIKVGDNCIFSYRVIFTINQREKEGKLVFDNMFTHNGEEYFLCDITDLYAVVRGDEIIMMNGYVMTSEIEESKIILPKHIRKLKGVVKAKVLNIGHPLFHTKPIAVKQYDTIHFNPNKAQKYKINGKKFCIIKQSQILGKVAE